MLLSDLLAGHARRRRDAAARARRDGDRRQRGRQRASGTSRSGSRSRAARPSPGPRARAVTGPEVLKMQTMGNDASRATVASGVNSWQVSPDGTRWYWLSAASTKPTGAGAVQSAPFPAGTSPVAHRLQRLQFEIPTPSSLRRHGHARRSLKVFADPVGAPTTSKSLDTGVVAFLAFERAGAPSPTSRRSSATPTGASRVTDLFVKKTDGTGACTLTSATDGVPVRVRSSRPARAAVGLDPAGDHVGIDAQYTRLSDCMKHDGRHERRLVRPADRRQGDRVRGRVRQSPRGTATLKFRESAAGGRAFGRSRHAGERPGGLARPFRPVPTSRLHASTGRRTTTASTSGDSLLAP